MGAPIEAHTKHIKIIVKILIHLRHFFCRQQGHCVSLNYLGLPGSFLENLSGLPKSVLLALLGVYLALQSLCFFTLCHFTVL